MEKVFEALTNPDLTVKYWFGFRVDAAGPTGATFTARSPGGEKFNKGVILESDPPRRLALLPRCGARPSGRRAEKANELAAPHVSSELRQCNQTAAK